MYRLKFGPLVALLIVAGLGVTCNSQEHLRSGEGGSEPMPKGTEVRQPVVAGSFYPGDPASLTKIVDDLLASVPIQNVPGDVVGLIVPHAGYPYSGLTAAHGYRQLQGRRYDTVIMVGPCHRAYTRAASVYDHGRWKTPLGEVEIDSDLAARLIAYHEQIAFVPEAHRQEHSLEVQLPFLQRTLRQVRIVPIAMGEQSYALCSILAEAIAASVGDRSVLLLASTDLYHGESYNECRSTDQRTIGYIEQFDADGLSKALASEQAQACGGGPVVTVMLASRLLGADTVTVLHRTNSGDVTGTKHGYVVGYVSAAISQTEERVEPDDELNKDEQSWLLHQARQVIESRVRGTPFKSSAPPSERLKKPSGAFVTINKRGMLRGCIGYIHAIKPLQETVIEMAVAAATSDPRFPPVSPDELDDLEVEISVLTPLKLISRPEDIEVGRHGLYIRKNAYSGLLLPQVATSNGWDRWQFLQQTCRKAGLPPDAWKEGAEIYTFTAQIFHEKP